MVPCILASRRQQNPSPPSRTGENTTRCWLRSRSASIPRICSRCGMASDLAPSRWTHLRNKARCGSAIPAIFQPRHADFKKVSSCKHLNLAEQLITLLISSYGGDHQSQQHRSAVVLELIARSHPSPFIAAWAQKSTATNRRKSSRL
jgi:hypothetical protein